LTKHQTSCHATIVLLWAPESSVISQDSWRMLGPELAARLMTQLLNAKQEIQIFAQTPTQTHNICSTLSAL